MSRTRFPIACIQQLQQLGLETLGAIARLPRAALAARFGPEGQLAWDVAQGRDTRPVLPPPREATVTESLCLPAPITSREMLLFALRQLVSRAFRLAALRHRQVRQVLLRVSLEGDRSWERLMTFTEPYGEQGLVEALELRLHAVELPGPAEALSLVLGGLVAEVARQERLPTLQARRPAPLTEAIEQLTQRYGFTPVYRVVEVEPWSRIPERRHALISYTL